MPIDTEDYRLRNLNNYCGLVFNLPLEEIPIRLATETYRVGLLELWEYQHFVNHEHPDLCFDGHFEDEIALANVWRIDLETMPSQRFIIEISPFDRMSWYQVTRNSPTEDETDWETPSAQIFDPSSPKEIVIREGESDDTSHLFKTITARTGTDGICERCQSAKGFTNPEVSSLHRGVKVIECLECKEKLIHSIRIIREKVNF